MTKDPYIQILRGISISAVVLIHCLPQIDWVVALRPFLNSCVAMFIFLSGYLTSKWKTKNVGDFYRRRISKVLAPYLFWSIIYLTLRMPISGSRIPIIILTGEASGQLYYLLVYAQLVVLTPVILKMLDYQATRVLLYSITPLSLAVRYFLSLCGIALPVQSFFGIWIIYYIVGLEWDAKIQPKLDAIALRIANELPWLLGGLILQELEGHCWLAMGNFDLATSQLKLSNLLCSLIIICISMSHKSSLPLESRFANIMKQLGDSSYGIYLLHMVPIILINGVVLDTTFQFTCIKWIVTLSISWCFVYWFGSILPNKVNALIGFR